MAGVEESAACSSPQRRSNADQERTPSLTNLLSLTTYQQQQLIQSWPRLRSSGFATGAEIFRKLAIKCPRVKETFQKANIVGRFARPPGYDSYKEHGKALYELLHAAIKSLNESSAQDLIDLCGQFGSKHSALRAGNSGFQTRMWDDLAELMAEHITRSEAVRGRRESMKAWTTVIMFLVDKLKDGYDSGHRKPAGTNAQADDTGEGTPTGTN